MQNLISYYSDDSSLRNGGGGGGPECLECGSSWRSIGFGEGDSHNEDCCNKRYCLFEANNIDNSFSKIFSVVKFSTFIKN